MTLGRSRLSVICQSAGENVARPADSNLRPRLLRTYTAELFPRIQMDECEAEGGGALA